MTTQHIQTLIIGAGQAGLSTGYHLQRRGLPFLIVDAADRVGDNWRRQWDTLRLYTPAKYDGLPGLPFPAEPWHYPHKDEVGDYLERYALEFDLPVRMSTRVRRLAAARRRLPRRARRRRHHLRQRRRRDRVVRPHALRPRLRRRPGPGHPAAALQRLPPARAAPARPGPRRRRLALRLRHRLRGRTDAPDRAGRPRLRADPDAARLAPGSRHVPGRSCSSSGTC